MSSQGISAIENIVGNPHVVNHNAIPAACFTHPEIAFVGLSEEQSKVNAPIVSFFCMNRNPYVLLFLRRRGKRRDLKSGNRSVTSKQTQKRSPRTKVTESQR